MPLEMFNILYQFYSSTTIFLRTKSSLSSTSMLYSLKEDATIWYQSDIPLWTSSFGSFGISLVLVPDVVGSFGFFRFIGISLVVVEKIKFWYLESIFDIEFLQWSCNAIANVKKVGLPGVCVCIYYI